MRISDWSSDVCSSDLAAGLPCHALLGAVDILHSQPGLAKCQRTAVWFALRNRDLFSLVIPGREQAESTFRSSTHGLVSHLVWAVRWLPAVRCVLDGYAH